jgi:DNA-directed RNA polymerase subunit RPC12/RpoP
MSTCGRCGAQLVPPPLTVEDTRVACPRCNCPIVFRGVLTNAAIIRDAATRKAPRMSDARLEQLVRGNIELAHCLDAVRPTTELLEHCYDTLRKHGIVWHR